MDTEVRSSFPSLRKTVVHLFTAEYVWISRLNRTTPPKPDNKDLHISKEELCEKWLDASQQFVRYAESLSIASLEKVIHYQNTKGESFHQKVYEIMMHCMNHSTYHRGQIITIFHEVDFTELGSTDLITYYRERKKK